MKEATGELNMTVVTLIAIAAIGAVFYFVVWPIVQAALVTQTCRSSYGAAFYAVRGEAQNNIGSNAKVYRWECHRDANEETGDTAMCYDADTGLECTAE
jgi:hypothetical protein